MRVKQVLKVLLPFLCALYFVVFYYFLKTINPYKTNYRGDHVVQNSLEDISNLLTWFRCSDAENYFKLNNIEVVGWSRSNNVKRLIKWLEQIVANEGESSTDEIGEGFDVDENTLRLLKEAAQKKPEDGSAVIAVLVLACDRVTVARCLYQLLNHRPSEDQFPIIVSRDCDHNLTATVISFFGDRGVFSVRQPDQSPIAVPAKQKHIRRYYNVARHYRWLLNLTFDTVGFDSAIVVEDDLDISQDFFEYFAATRKLLARDPSLWCVSAWNDNGKRALVNPKAVDLIHRTDFFPGLGWMLTRSEWARLGPRWPIAFWDDWLRDPEQRLGRACLRPEISRTQIFSARGVSNGQYKEHISRVCMNNDFVPFTHISLDHLLKHNYDPQLDATVTGSPSVTMLQLLNGSLPDSETVRITYASYKEFKMLAHTFHLMEDIRSGVPRTAYRGVVTFMCRGVRVYLAPKYPWAGYNVTRS